VLRERGVKFCTILFFLLENTNMVEVRQFEHGLYKKNLNGFVLASLVSGVLASLVSGVYHRLVWLPIVTHRVKCCSSFCIIGKRDESCSNVSEIPYT